MKPHIRMMLFSVAMIACASTQSRIKKHQAAFDGYPTAVQANIRAGLVEVGYTSVQVEMALGRPDRIFVRKTAAVTQDVWAYGTSSVRPGLSLGLGMGSGGGGFYGGGMGLASDSGHEDRARVVFENGVVVAVEKLQR